MQECARGVLLTPSGQILLLETVSGSGALWITPGGRILPGEEATAAAVREVQEETGRGDLVSETELWVRRGSYLSGGTPQPERERFFLIRTDAFEPDAGGMEPRERHRHRSFRWWTAEEIGRSSDAFVPRHLAELLRDLVRLGPPPRPIEFDE